MRLTFLGAANTVTGSRYLVETDSSRVLIDCGLDLGVKSRRNRNWRALEVDPRSLDAVILTHAHIDHSGMLPALVRDGFSGPIYATPPTIDLCEILLPDAAHLQEEDARYANRKGYSKHRPALPLYTIADAELALERLEPIEFHEEARAGGIGFQFQRAGHILGAASVRLWGDSSSVLFSGDLGRDDDLLMPAPDPPADADFVVVESTYGDRCHERHPPIETLAEIVEDATERSGILLIPSFAVGRAQTLLYCLHEVFRRELATRVPVFVNSPMATRVTDLFRMSAPEHRLSRSQSDSICGVARFVQSVDESRALVERSGPAVIISASGMATGGRVLHHLKTVAPNSRNTILLPGFQAPGTRGDALAHGAQTIKIHGERIPVRARVRQLDIYSAHADQAGILDWLGATSRPPRGIFVTHGEPVAADTIRMLASERLGVPAIAPDLLDAVDLEDFTNIHPRIESLKAARSIGRYVA